MSEANSLVLEPSGVICIKATNRQALIDYAWGVVRSAYPAGDYPDPEVFVRVELQDCGSIREYKTADDVPHESVPCDCGNPQHWLIKYDE